MVDSGWRSCLFFQVLRGWVELSGRAARRRRPCTVLWLWSVLVWRPSPRSRVSFFFPEDRDAEPPYAPTGIEAETLSMMFRLPLGAVERVFFTHRGLRVACP